MNNKVATMSRSAASVILSNVAGCTSKALSLKYPLYVAISTVTGNHLWHIYIIHTCVSLHSYISASLHCTTCICAPLCHCITMHIRSLCVTASLHQCITASQHHYHEHHCNITACIPASSLVHHCITACIISYISAFSYIMTSF